MLRRFVITLVAASLLRLHLYADPVPVRHLQGSVHVFLSLKTSGGSSIAIGEVTQAVRGDRVTARLIFRFRDGSIDEETTVFSQRGTFRLISDHLVQRGPSFPKWLDILIDVPTGEITSRTKDGVMRHDHLDLPADISNGLPPNLLMNLLPSDLETKLSFVAPTEKPRLIHVTVKPSGEVPFTIGGTRRKATDYVLHVQLGGVAGVIAPIIGKQPDDVHIWILGGASPAFIREAGQLYEGGPVWYIEQISPTFAR